MKLIQLLDHQKVRKIEISKIFDGGLCLVCVCVCVMKRSLSYVPRSRIIVRTFSLLWRVCNGFKIQNLGDHKMLFTFDNKLDVDRFLLSELWSFDKHLAVMQQYEKEVPIQELKFDKASFWVQHHGIPLRYMSMDAAEKISAVIGEVYRPTESKEADGG